MANERFWSRVSKTDGCWLWTARTQAKRGYGLMWWNGKTTGAHRVSYEIHHGEIHSGSVVMHTCDTPACVNPAHLVVGTHADNQYDKVRKQRQARGSSQGHAKLVESQVLEIRARLAAGERQNHLAREFGVNPCTINDIAKRRWWRHL